MDPYGNPVGSKGTWPDRHGFLDKPHNEVTGLTDVGARTYDPATGRFLSVDPLLKTGSPQQWAGYTYADNNPTTLSDQSGLSPVYCLMDDCYRAKDGRQVSGPTSPAPTAADLGPGRPGVIHYGGNWSLVVDTAGDAYLNGIVRLPWSPLAADVMVQKVKDKFGEIVTPMGEDDNAEDSVGALMAYCRDVPDGCTWTAHRFLLVEALRVHALIGSFDGGGRGGGKGSQRSIVAATKRLLNQVSDFPGVRPKPGNIAVIGRLPDTAVAKDWPGHDVMDLPRWNLAKNDAWMNEVIKNRQDVYVASPTPENLWNAEEGRPTVTARELKMLTDAGYKWDGHYLRPPKK
jgi:RHS repeat-associated protein